MSAYSFENLASIVHPSWHQLLTTHRELITGIGRRLEQAEREGARIAPPAPLVLRSLEMPLDAVRVLIIGQDPYPIEGDAIGRAFAVATTTQLVPQSLKNIFSELQADVHCVTSPAPDLQRWVEQGVMLLNRCLTVEIGNSASHKSWGWQQLTDAIVEMLVQRQFPLVAILWGNQAQEVSPLLGNAPTVLSAHPSPLSAYRGFFGSRPFSKANQLLLAQGSSPISWC